MLFCFFHDHKFRFDGRRYYSTGGLSETTLSKYISENDEIYVFARVVPLAENEQIGAIEDKRIHIMPFDGYAYKEIVQKADYCICRLPSIVGLLALRTIRRYRKRYLVEVVGSAKDAYRNHGLIGRVLAGLFEHMTKQAVGQADYVTYVTQKYLQSSYPNAKNSVGVSDVRLEDASADVLEKRLQKIENQEKECVLATVGNYEVRYKSQETMIRALGQLKKHNHTNYRYHLVGSGDKTYLATIAKEENVEDMVVFRGALPHDQMFDFYDEIDIYVQPSLLEGLCRSVVEAMSRGCPCLLSKVGGNTELVDDCFLFQHGKKAVMQVVDILEKYDKATMMQAAKCNFEEAKKYSTNRLDAIWKEFYQKFLDNKQD